MSRTTGFSLVAACLISSTGCSSSGSGGSPALDGGGGFIQSGGRPPSGGESGAGASAGWSADANAGGYAGAAGAAGISGAGGGAAAGGPTDAGGVCTASAECKVTGGCCEARSFEEPWCPDGFRWDKFESVLGCSDGAQRNTCCVPWNAACSYVSLSQTLDLDPFTCAKPTGTGLPWTCIHPKEQTSCKLDVQLEQPLGDIYAGKIELGASFASQVKLTGSDPTGRTFECSGKISYDAFSPESWSCSACAAGNCKTCTIVATADCNL